MTRVRPTAWRRRGAAVLGVLVLAFVASACGGSGAESPPSSSAATPTSSSAATPASSSAATPASSPASAAGSAGPCGTATGGQVRYTHVVWIWMENKPYGSVIGSSSAPYENSLAAQCGLATNYHGVAHPSLPNYLAATGGSTFGVQDDAGPSAHPIGADSIFGQLQRAGLSWRSYEESMPKNCDIGSSGRYAVKHNPAAYYTSIRAACADDDVPFETAFGRDVAAGTLPSFSFVTPNMCDDTHDCSVRTGDKWLSTWLAKLLAGPNYRAGDTLVVLTWDEGTGSANLIPTIVVGPSVRPGTRAAARLDHYSLLRTTQDLLGLAHLQASASAPSLAAAFGL